MTKVKTAQQIQDMREGGKMLAQVLNLLVNKTAPGISTQELADIAKQELKRLGGDPAFLGYSGFPDVLCVSINHEVVHGIPKADRIIKDGDIVSLDFGVKYRGLITDAARTLIVGKSNGDKKRLVETTREALMKGIAEVKDGCKVGDISFAVQKTLEQGGLGVVRDLVGHGVGSDLHEEPNIPNFGVKNQGPILRAGMTIAIEPMAALGGFRVKIEPDGWTVRTVDGSLSAHFEDTVLVTHEGSMTLTA